MSTLTDIIEKAAEVAIEDYVTNSPVGAEEKALMQAVLAAYKAPSLASIATVFDDVVKVVGDLKAQIAAPAIAPSATSDVEPQ